MALTERHYPEAADLFSQAAGLVPSGHTKETGDYLNRQADALYHQGDEKGDNAALKRSIEIWHLVLVQRPRERVPLDWAEAQNNLGIAFSVLGARESGTCAAGGGGRYLPRRAAGEGSARLASRSTGREPPRRTPSASRFRQLGEREERDRTAGGGSCRLPCGARGLDPRARPAPMGVGTEQPWNRAFGARGARERNGAAGGGSCRLPGRARGENP